MHDGKSQHMKNVATAAVAPATAAAAAVAAEVVYVAMVREQHVVPLTAAFSFWVHQQKHQHQGPSQSQTTSQD